MILPALYRRDVFPPADGLLPGLNEPPSLELKKCADVALLPNHVVLDASTSQLIGPTFSRRRVNYHGGVVYVQEKNAYEYRPATKSRETRTIVEPGACTYTDRPVYYADSEIPFIYGHVLIEALTRLWALGDVPSDVLVATSTALDPTLTKLMASLGVRRECLVHIDRPLIAKSCFFATVPVARRKWIHPAAWEVFDRIKRLAVDSDIPLAERIFLSRARVPERALVNQRQVEAYFKSKGFLVVHPQDLRIQDQIRLISSAKLIAGVGGSAMLNALFAADAKVLILCSEGWLVNLDILLSQQPGRLGYVFGTPADRPEEGHRTSSPWWIDMDDVREAVRLHFDLPRDGTLYAVRVIAKRLQGRANEVPGRTQPLE